MTLLPSVPLPQTRLILQSSPTYGKEVFEERSRFSSQVRIEQGQIDGSRLSVRRRIFKIMIAQVAAHNTKNRMVHRGEGGELFRFLCLNAAAIKSQVQVELCVDLRTNDCTHAKRRRIRV
jgi:hypothetical protein